MTRWAWINGGLVLGVIAGVWDGIAILLENPRSFSGAATSIAFLGGALALNLTAGAAGGVLAAFTPGLTRVLSPARLITAGLALWIFLWVGIRIHVRFLFGEPLTSPRSLLVNAVALLLSAGVALLVWKVGARRGEPLLARRAVTIGTVALLAGAIAAAALGPSRMDSKTTAAPAPESARDVLLVTLDTTRADHLSCYGYPRGTTPALDRLARRGVTSRGWHAPIPLTNPSHCSLFTGRLPREHGVVNNGMALPDSVPTFVEDLAERGWNCAAFVSGIPLKAGLSGLTSGFAVYDDVFSPLERVHPMLTTLALVRAANRILPMDLIERRAATTCAAAIRWLSESESPRFLWVHLFDPHTPYDAPKPIRDRFGQESPRWSAHGKPVTGWPIADYDAELREADRHLEDLLRAFEDVTSGSGSILVSSDHGEGLGEHGELTHGALLHGEDLRVPGIAFHGKAAPGRVPCTPNSVTSELRPTTRLAAVIPVLAGAAAPREVKDAREPVLCETFAPEGRQDKSAVIGHVSESHLGKLIVNWETGEEIAFLVGEDPAELVPVRAQGPGWDALREHLPAREIQQAAELDPETERRLRALGYVH